jgi:electron transfer flavoprotein alpha subunit
MTTLLIAEHDNAALKDATHKALTAARALAAPVHVLVAGEGCRGVADAAAKLDGVGKVLLADAPAYGHMLAEPLAALVVALAASYDAIVAAATTTGKNFMPRVAALLDVMQISDIVKVIAPDTFERLIYAGNAVQTVRSRDKVKVLTVRTSTFAAAGSGGTAPIENAAAAADPGISSARAHLGENHHFRRPRDAEPREFQQIYRAGCGQARRCRWRLARRRRRRLCAQRLAGWPNR